MKQPIKIIRWAILSVCISVSVTTFAQGRTLPKPGSSQQSIGDLTAQQVCNQRAVVAVESAGMTVSDMDRVVEFYSQVLSFKKVFDVEVLGTEYEQLQGVFGIRLRVVKMQLGEELIELTEYLTPRGRPIPIDSRSNDHWFQHIAIVVSDIDRAYQHLRKFKVQHVSTAPQQLPEWNKAAAGIRAFYFKDPDGHNLEIIDFPPGKGNPKWQKFTNQLFLGIDHTAIVVSSTTNSLKFYRDLLGLELAGESMNYGIEQEYLNNVQGARLRISGLKSPAGPGIEFLEYLRPTDGRSLPTDARPNDLLHWQTTLVVKNIEAIAQRLRLNQSTFISDRVVTLPEQSLGFKRGILVRDPDGHALRLVEKAEMNRCSQ
ncbi:MAG: VOC family protein [Leptolyngbyaceae cyanobacterium HOT.MB2.61]|nr:VOC family protein [Leptolyngbyaceae cyanobacterium HOT.MB2.61]